MDTGQTAEERSSLSLSSLLYKMGILMPHRVKIKGNPHGPA